MPSARTQHNRMFYVLFTVSLLVHLGVLIYLNDLYKKETLLRIEVTLKETVEAAKRVIPTPPNLIRPPEKTKDIERVTVTQPLNRNLEPTTIEPVDYSALKRAESMGRPHFVKSTNPIATVWNPQTSVDSNSSLSSREYLAMVRLRIERHKQYPNAAKTRQLEGAVVVHFVITLDGNVEAIQIRKSSGHSILDRAGLTAVRDAAPFPKPPREIFKSDIPIQVPIVFELT